MTSETQNVEWNNPQVARAFFRAGLIEAWGRRIHPIRERCVEAGNQTPLWTREPGGALRLRFQFSEDYLAADAAACGVRGDDSQKTARTGPSPDNRPKATERASDCPKDFPKDWSKDWPKDRPKQ